MEPSPFFLIGAEKAGTSSLVSCLERHPELCLADTEPMNDVRSRLSNGTEEYLFNECGKKERQQRPGKKIAYALRSPSAAELLHTHFPSADFIISLRNPVDRAYSSWWMYYQRGDDRRSFEEAVREDMTSAPKGAGPERRDQVPNHVAEGYYARQLERYLTYFPKEQIKCIFFERFRNEPEPVLRDLISFLGVSSDVDLYESIQQKPSMGVLGLFATRIAYATGLFWLVPESIRREIRQVISSIDADRPEMEPEIRKKLHHHYCSQNEQLARLLDLEALPWST